MDPIMIGLIGIAVFLVLIFLGMNIGTAMAITGFFGYVIMINTNAAMAQMRTDPATQASTYSMMVMPLFILMGNLAFEAGMSGGLYDFSNKWLNRVPGSLSCATIVACAGFGAICGSNAATCATMGTVSLPEMRKHGYADRLSTGSIAIGGTLGMLIPPSTPMILYCIMTGASIGKQFMAGVLPGILLAFLSVMMVVIMVVTNRSLAPSGDSFTWKERFISIKGIIPVIVLFGIVLGGMFTGFFSVNQSAAIGAFLAFVIMVVMMILRREFSWKAVWEKTKRAFWTTIRTFSMTYLIIIGASLFCKFLAVTQLPMTVANFIADLDVSVYVIIALMTFVYLILGMIMDELPMIMLTVPIFWPIVDALGFDVLWFGIYIILTMALGAIAPPVGLNCFIISGIAKDVPLSTIYRGALPFVIAILVAIAIITIWPGIVTVLPNLMSI